MSNARATQGSQVAGGVEQLGVGADVRQLVRLQQGVLDGDIGHALDDRQPLGDQPRLRHGEQLPEIDRDGRALAGDQIGLLAGDHRDQPVVSRSVDVVPGGLEPLGREESADLVAEKRGQPTDQRCDEVGQALWSTLGLQSLRHLVGEIGHIGPGHDLVGQAGRDRVLHRGILAERGDGLHVGIGVEYLTAEIDGHHGQRAEQRRHKKERTRCHPAPAAGPSATAPIRLLAPEPLKLGAFVWGQVLARHGTPRWCQVDRRAPTTTLG